MELNKENLYREYIINNKSRKECSKVFNCSEALIVKRLSIYDIKKDRKEAAKNIKKSMINKYGVENAAQLNTNHFKNISNEEKEIIQKKRVQTLVNNFSNDIIKKRDVTSLLKYGVTSYTQTDEYKKYIKERASGRENYSVIWDKEQLTKYISSFDYKPTISKLASTLNYSYPVIEKRIREFNLENLVDIDRGQVNVRWHDLILDKLGINLEYEGSIFGDNQRCDLYYEDKKIGIDINPTASHNIEFNVYIRKSIENANPTYHRDRAILAEENGWFLYQVYDWDNEDEVLSQLRLLFGLGDIILSDDCIVNEISPYEYGLYYNDKLIAKMTFKESEEADIELVTYCPKDNIIGGASKLFEYAVSLMKYNSVIAYSDMNKENDSLYNELKFQFYKYGDLNHIYAPEKPTGEYLNINDTNHTKEYFNNKKWYLVNDAGSKIWIWKRF